MGETRPRFLRVALPIVLGVVVSADLQIGPAGAQAPQTIVIRGQVRTGDDSAAVLRRARVAVLGTDAAPAPVFTDRDGRFAIAVPRTFTALRVTKPGFAPRIVPAAGVPADGELPVRLERGAAIGVRVVDELGRGVADASVRVYAVPDESGRRAVAFETRQATDDRGELRVGSLAAGAYRVVVDAGTTRATALLHNQTIVRGRSAAPLPLSSISDSTPASARDDGDGSVVRLDAGSEAFVHVQYAADAEVTSITSYIAGFDAATMDNPRGKSARGGGSISGRVLGPEGFGMPGALVRLVPVSGGVSRVSGTNALGDYVFTALPQGSYRIIARKHAHADGEWGQERAGEPGRVVSLRNDQRIDSLDVRMRPAGVITGIITDVDGEPLEGMTLQAWRVTYQDGRPVLEAAALPRTSDDRGNYRLFGLPPATYYVVATDERGVYGGEDAPRAGRSFFPGVPQLLEAAPLRLEAGVDVVAADLSFRPGETFQVRVAAFNSQGGPVNRPVALVGSSRTGGVAFPVQLSTPGSAVFNLVSPGAYVVHAAHVEESGAPTPVEYGTLRITVDAGDVPNVSLTTAPGGTINGRVTAPGLAPPFQGRPWFGLVAAEPDEEPVGGLPRPWVVEVRSDLSWQARGVVGSVRVVPTDDVPPDLWLASATTGGLDRTERPFALPSRASIFGLNVVFSNDGTQLTGYVVDAAKTRVRAYHVAAFPVGERLWSLGPRYVKTAVPDEDGRFRVPMLPPGQYWLAAVDTLEPDAIRDPNLMRRLRTVARRIDASRGGTIDTELTLQRVPSVP